MSLAYLANAYVFITKHHPCKENNARLLLGLLQNVEPRYYEYLNKAARLDGIADLSNCFKGQFMRNLFVGWGRNIYQNSMHYILAFFADYNDDSAPDHIDEELRYYFYIINTFDKDLCKTINIAELEELLSHEFNVKEAAIVSACKLALGYQDVSKKVVDAIWRLEGSVYRLVLGMSYYAAAQPEFARMHCLQIAIYAMSDDLVSTCLYFFGAKDVHRAFFWLYGYSWADFIEEQVSGRFDELKWLIN